MSDVVSYSLQLRDQASAPLKEVAEAAEEATVGLQRTEAAAQEVTAGLGDMSGGLSRAGAGLSTINDGAGKAESVIMGLSGALGVVSPELGNLTRNLGDAAGGLDALTRLGPRLIGVFGLITAAVTAGAVAWSKYKRELEEAEARQAKAAETSARAAQAAADLSGFLNEVELNSLVAGGELDESALQARTAQLQAEAGFAETKALLQERINAALEEEARLRALSAEETMAGVQATYDLRDAEAETLALREQMAGLDTQIANTAATILETLAATSSSGRSSGGGAAAAPVPVSIQFIDPAALVAANSTDATRFGFGGFQGMSFDSTIPETGLRDLIAARIGVFQGNLSEFAPNLQTRATSAAGAVGGLAQGDPSALLSLIPGGGLIGGIAAVGKMGADGVGDMLSGFTDAFMAGLEALPEILSEIIPEFVGTLVTEVIPALIRSAPELFWSLIQGLGELLKDLLVPDAVTNAFDGDPTTRVFDSGGALDKFFGGVDDTDRARQARGGGLYGGSAQLAVPSGGPVQIQLSAQDAIGLLVDRLQIELGPNGRRAGVSL